MGGMCVRTLFSEVAYDQILLNNYGSFTMCSDPFSGGFFFF